MKSNVRWLIGLVVIAGVGIATSILRAPTDPSPRRSRSQSYGILATWSGARQGPESREAAPGSEAAGKPSRPTSAAESDQPQDWEVFVVGADGKPASNQNICARLSGDSERIHHNVAQTDGDGRAVVRRPPAGESWTVCIGGRLQVDLTQPHTRVAARNLVPFQFIMLDGVTGRPLAARVTRLVSHVWRGGGGGRCLREVVVDPPEGYYVPNGPEPSISWFAERVRAVVIGRPEKPAENPEEPDFLVNWVNRPFSNPQSKAALGLGHTCMSGRSRTRLRQERERKLRSARAEGRGTVGASVAVTVTRRNGRPAGKAAVRLDGPVLRWAWTGSDGHTELAGVPAGEYQVSVHALGFAYVQRKIVVGGDGHVRIDLEEPAGWTASVTVVDGSGRPVPMAGVQFGSTQSYVHLVHGTQTVGLCTDASGGAVLPGIDYDSVKVSAGHWRGGYGSVELSRRSPNGEIQLR